MVIVLLSFSRIAFCLWKGREKNLIFQLPFRFFKQLKMHVFSNPSKTESEGVRDECLEPDVNLDSDQFMIILKVFFEQATSSAVKNLLK